MSLINCLNNNFVCVFRPRKFNSCPNFSQNSIRGDPVVKFDFCHVIFNGSTATAVEPLKSCQISTTGAFFVFSIILFRRSN